MENVQTPPTFNSLKSHLSNVSKTSLKSTFVSYRRSKHKIYHSSIILDVQGVDTRECAENIVGNEVEFISIYRNKKSKNNSTRCSSVANFSNNNNNLRNDRMLSDTTDKRYRRVKGYISRVHGNSGKVIAVMDVNLSPNDITKNVYIKLYKR